jgi:hypothetical protein
MEMYHFDRFFHRPNYTTCAGKGILQARQFVQAAPAAGEVQRQA